MISWRQRDIGNPWRQESPGAGQRRTDQNKWFHCKFFHYVIITDETNQSQSKIYHQPISKLLKNYQLKFSKFQQQILIIISHSYLSICMSNPSQFQYTIKNALRYLYKVYDSTLQFINKMTEPTQDNINIQPLLSPKQAQERRARTTTLQNIDKQIEDILAMNTIKHIQFEDFAHSLNTLQTVYVKENKELKEAIRKLKNDYECLQKMYLTTKQELELSIDHLEQKTIEYQRMQKETIKLKKMVHNQQTLLDDYRKNIEEEIALERELMNSMYEENKNKLQKEFNHALQQIQKQYEQKIKKISNHCKAKQYRTQCNQLKKYLQSNKELLGKPNNRPDKTSCKPISSEYSTNDQQTRHNTAIFMP